MFLWGRSKIFDFSSDSNIFARNRFFINAPYVNIIKKELKASYDNIHHNLKSSKIEKEEEKIRKISECLENHQNPFADDDIGLLRNIFINAIVPEEPINDIINVRELGQKSFDNFIDERLTSTSKTPLWSAVCKNRFSNFKNAFYRKTKTPTRDVKVERNVLAKFIVAARSSRD